MLKLIKELFNKILSEKSKEIIREKFKKLFVYLDKRLYFKEYMKACRSILYQDIYQYEGLDYGHRYGHFLQMVRNEYIKLAVIADEPNTKEQEMLKAINYIKTNGVDVYCGSLKDISIYSENDIGYDAENQLYYGIYEGKKLYFSQVINSVQEALQYLNGLAAEQSEHSPHKYLTEEFNVSQDDIVFDIGSAEGNFALSIVDKVREIYLFECEEVWMKPLGLTFAPYKDKVHIIRKYASKEDGDNAVSIDAFCKENKIEKIGLIKMDVEGAEADVLVGAKEMIQNERIERIAACTYHRVEDKETLSAMLPNYRKTYAEGYMLGALIWPFGMKDTKPPYFTKGVMRATLDKNGK